ncbi:GAF domain-containing protein [Hyalangium sp.]|uniref:GAF domain-containing protein n=1 Tax=Hyalangium sp. TaxID=2028555 RepID=UPI002D248937|nr:GAF domain-containing protein [Hyalangium sp.]HYH96278.1 GAF domain-containing protein [Hyalangium sp.]
MIEIFKKISEATKLLMETGFEAKHVTAALAQLGPSLGVDRLYLYENQPFPIRGRLLADARYGWSAPGVLSVLESATMRQISIREMAPLWADMLAAGQLVSSLASDAPPRVKLVLTELKTQSLLLVPIQQGKEKWGFIGMDDCRQARVWTAAETTLLKSLAGGLGTALRHKQMRSSLSQTRTQLAEMMLLSATR